MGLDQLPGDGATFIFADSKEICRRNIASEDTRWSVPTVAAQQAWGLDVSPDQMRFALAGIGRTIEIRDSSNGVLLGRLAGHTSPPRFQFTPDGRHILSIDHDDMIVWSVASMTEVYRKKLSGLDHDRLVVSPDGRTVVTAGGAVWDKDEKIYVKRFEGDTFALRQWQLPESVWPKAADIDDSQQVGGDERSGE